MKCLPTYNGIRFNTLDELKQYIVNQSNEAGALNRKKLKSNVSQQRDLVIDANSENELLAAMAMNSSHAYKNGKISWNPTFMFKGKKYRDVEDAWNKLRNKKEKEGTEEGNFRLLTQILYSKLIDDVNFFNRLRDAENLHNEQGNTGLFFDRLAFKEGQETNILSSSWVPGEKQGNWYVRAMQDAYEQAYNYHNIKGYKNTILDPEYDPADESKAKNAKWVQARVNEIYMTIPDAYDMTMGQVHGEALRKAKFISKYSPDFANDQDRAEYLKLVEAELNRQKTLGIIGASLDAAMESSGSIRQLTNEELEMDEMDESDFYHKDANARIGVHRKRFKPFFDWMRANGYAKPEVLIYDLIKDKTRTPDNITMNEKTYNDWVMSLDDKLLADGLWALRLKNFISLKVTYDSMNLQMINMLRIDAVENFSVMQINATAMYGSLRKQLESHIKHISEEKLFEYYDEYQAKRKEIDKEITSMANAVDKKEATHKDLNKLKYKYFQNDLKYLSLITGIQQDVWDQYFNSDNEHDFYVYIPTKVSKNKVELIATQTRFKSMRELFDTDYEVVSKPNNYKFNLTAVTNLMDNFMVPAKSKDFGRATTRHPFERYEGKSREWTAKNGGIFDMKYLKPAILKYFLDYDIKQYSSNILKLSNSISNNTLGEFDYQNSENQRKTAHELSSDLTRSFERIKSLAIAEHPYLIDNEYVEDVQKGFLDGVLQRIDFFERVDTIEGNKRVADKDFHPDDNLFFMFMLFLNGYQNKISNYLSPVAQFGNKDQIYATNVKLHNVTKESYEKVANLARQKGEQFATYEQVLKTPLRSTLIEMIRANGSVGLNFNDALREYSTEQIEYIIDQFLLNYAINSYYLGQVAFGLLTVGKNGNFDSLFELLKRSGSTNSTGYVPDNEVYGGIGWRTDQKALMQAVQDAISQGISPMTIDIRQFEKKVNTHRVAIVADPLIEVYINEVTATKKRFEITDGIKIITKEWADRLQISVGDIHANTQKYPKFNQVKDLITFKSKTGKYSLTKSNSIVIDELADILPFPLLKGLKELMEKNDIDMLIFKSAAKKREEGADISSITIEKGEGLNKVITINPDAKLTIVERENDNYGIQQDLRSDTYPKPGKQPIQLQGNQMRFDAVNRLNQYWYNVQNKAYIEVEKQFSKMTDASARLWLYERASRTENSDHIIELLADGMSLNHPELVEFRKDSIRSLVNKKILRRQSNRLKMVEIPNINIGHNSDLKGMEKVPVKIAGTVVQKVRLPEVVAAVAGARAAQLYDTYEEASLAARKYDDMIDETKQLKTWEIRKVKAEDGVTDLWEVPGEPILFHRVPADAMHSHTMARLKYNLHGTGMNFIITDPRTSVIAGSDKDGDTRLLEVTVNDRVERGKKVLPTLDKEQQKRDLYKQNVEIFRKNKLIEMFGLEYIDGMNINEELYDYINDYEFDINPEYPSPENKEAWKAEIDRLDSLLWDGKPGNSRSVDLALDMLSIAKMQTEPMFIGDRNTNSDYKVDYIAKYRPSDDAVINQILLETLSIYEDANNFDILTDPIDTDAFDSTLANAPKTIEGLTYNTIDFYLAARELATVGAAVIGIMANANTQFDIASNFKLRLHTIEDNPIVIRIPRLTLVNGKVVPGTNNIEGLFGDKSSHIQLTGFAEDRFGYIKGVMGNVLNLALDNLTKPKIGPLGVNKETANLFAVMMMMATELDKITNKKEALKATIAYADNVFAFLNHPLVKAYANYKIRNSRITPDGKYVKLKDYLEESLAQLDFDISERESEMIIKSILTLDGISYDFNNIKNFINIARNSPSSEAEFLQVINGYELIQNNELNYVDVGNLFTDPDRGVYSSKLPYFSLNGKDNGRKQLNHLFRMINPVVELQRMHVWDKSPIFTHVGQRVLRVANYNKIRRFNKDKKVKGYQQISNKKIILSKSEIERINRFLQKKMYNNAIPDVMDELATSNEMLLYGSKKKARTIEAQKAMSRYLRKNFDSIANEYTFNRSGRNAFFDLIEYYQVDEFNNPIEKAENQSEYENSLSKRDLSSKIQIREEYRKSALTDQQIQDARNAFEELTPEHQILFLNEVFQKYGYISEYYKSGNFSILLGISAHRVLAEGLDQVYQEWNDRSNKWFQSTVSLLVEELYTSNPSLDFEQDLKAIRAGGDTKNRILNDIEETPLFRERRGPVMPGETISREQSDFFELIKKTFRNIKEIVNINDSAQDFNNILYDVGLEQLYQTNFIFNPWRSKPTLYIHNQKFNIADANIDSIPDLLIAMYYAHMVKNGENQFYHKLFGSLLLNESFEKHLMIVIDKYNLMKAQEVFVYTPIDKNTLPDKMKDPDGYQDALDEHVKRHMNIIYSPVFSIAFTQALESEIAAHEIQRLQSDDVFVDQATYPVLHFWMHNKLKMLTELGYYESKYAELTREDNRIKKGQYFDDETNEISIADLLTNSTYKADPESYTEEDFDNQIQHMYGFDMDEIERKRGIEAKKVIRNKLIELINLSRVEKGLEPIQSNVFRLSSISIADIWAIRNNISFSQKLNAARRNYDKILDPSNIENIARLFIGKQPQPSRSDIKLLGYTLGYIYEQGAEDIRVNNKYSPLNVINPGYDPLTDMIDQFEVSEEGYLRSFGLTKGNTNSEEVEKVRKILLDRFYDKNGKVKAGIEINETFIDIIKNANTVEYLNYLKRIQAAPEVYSFTTPMSEYDYNQKTGYNPTSEQAAASQAKARKAISAIFKKMDERGLYSDIYAILMKEDIVNIDYINYLLDLQKVRNHWNTIVFDENTASFDETEPQLYYDMVHEISRYNPEASADLRTFLDHMIGMKVVRDLVLQENDPGYYGSKNQTIALADDATNGRMADIQTRSLGGWNVGKFFLHLDDIGPETPWVRSVARNLLLGTQKRKQIEVEKLRELNTLRKGWKEHWWNYILIDKIAKKTKTSYQVLRQYESIDLTPWADYNPNDETYNGKWLDVLGEIRHEFKKTRNKTEVLKLINIHVQTGRIKAKDVQSLKASARNMLHVLEMSLFLSDLSNELRPSNRNSKFKRLENETDILFPQMLLSDQEFIELFASKDPRAIIHRSRIKKLYRETRYDNVKISPTETYGQLKARIIHEIMLDATTHEMKQKLIEKLEAERKEAVRLTEMQKDINGRRIFSNMEHIRVQGLRTDIPDMLQSKQKFDVLEKYVRSLAKRTALIEIEPYSRYVLSLYENQENSSAISVKQSRAVEYLRSEISSRIYGFDRDRSDTKLDKMLEQAINYASIVQLSLSLSTGFLNLSMALLMNTFVYPKQTAIGAYRIMHDIAIKMPAFLANVSKKTVGMDTEIGEDFPFAGLIKALYVIHRLGVATVVEDATTITLSKALELAKRLLFITMEGSEKLAQSFAYVGMLSKEQWDAYTITGGIKPGHEKNIVSPLEEAVLAARLRSMHGKYGEFRARYFGNMVLRSFTQYTYPWLAAKMNVFAGRTKVNVFGEATNGMLMIIYNALSQLRYNHIGEAYDYKKAYDHMVSIQDEIDQLKNRSDEFSDRELDIQLNDLFNKLDEAKEDYENKKEAFIKLVDEVKRAHKGNEINMSAKQRFLYYMSTSDIDNGDVKWAGRYMSNRARGTMYGIGVLIAVRTSLHLLLQAMEDDLDEYYTFEVDGVKIKRKKLKPEFIRLWKGDNKAWQEFQEKINTYERIKRFVDDIDSYLNPSTTNPIFKMPLSSAAIFFAKSISNLVKSVGEYAFHDDDASLDERGYIDKPTLQDSYGDVKWVRDLIKMIPGQKLYFDIKKYLRADGEEIAYELITSDIVNTIVGKTSNFLSSIEMFMTIADEEQRNELRILWSEYQNNSISRERNEEMKELMTHIIYTNPDKLLELYKIEILSKEAAALERIFEQAQVRGVDVQLSMEVVTAISKAVVVTLIEQGNLYTNEEIDGIFKGIDGQFKDKGVIIFEAEKRRQEQLDDQKIESDQD